jgi:hypothetical protein
VSDLDQILGYAARSWYTFALKPKSKDPATKRGFYDATINPEKLKRWFARGYPYNVGIRTGLLSGVLVVDVDGILGKTSLQRLCHEYGPLPKTLASRTARGGHLWFAIDVPVPSSIGRVAPNIDIRANGGYVVAPPSIHPDGPVYEWIDYSVPLAPAPDWLITLALRKPTSAQIFSAHTCASKKSPASSESTQITASSSAAYGRAALEREIETLTRASSGCRNETLNYASFRLHQLVAGDELHASEVKQRLIAAARTIDLVHDDGLERVEATIASGARAGLLSPRNRWGRQ